MDVRRRRQRIWFELWIREGYSVRQLSQQSGHSESTLRRVIHYWLARPPKESQDFHVYRYLVMDGTYLSVVLGNRVSLFPVEKEIEQQETEDNEIENIFE